MGSLQTQDPNAYISGAKTDQGTYQEIPDALINGFSWKIHWYDVVRSTWRVREPRPSPHHSWLAGQWRLDRASMKEELRRVRNQRLRDSDWTQLPDAPANAQAQWAAYRQSLRDLPNRFNGDRLEEVEWPNKPS